LCVCISWTNKGFDGRPNFTTIKETDKIIVLYILLCMFLGSSHEDKQFLLDE